MGDNFSAKLPDIKDMKCRKDACQGGEAGAKNSGTCVHGSNVASFCRLPPDTSLFTFWAHSILQELALFADDRVPQQRKNVKHKQHVPIRTMQKVSLGYLSQPGSFPFVPLPCYALCLQITQVSRAHLRCAPAVYMKMLQRKRGNKGHKYKYRDEMVLLHKQIHNTVKYSRSLLHYWEISQSWCSFRSVDKQDCSSLA